MNGQIPKQGESNKKSFCYKNGRLYFTKKAERSFFFILTIIMLFIGIFYKTGVFQDGHDETGDRSIFHRVLFTPNVAGLIKEIKKQNKEIIFGTDDLIFDPKYLKHADYLNNVHYFEKKLYENGVGGEILNDSYVKMCVTTTPFLAEKLREKNKKVFIVPNKLSDKDLKNVDNILIKKGGK